SLRGLLAGGCSTRTPASAAGGDGTDSVASTGAGPEASTGGTSEGPGGTTTGYLDGDSGRGGETGTDDAANTGDDTPTHEPCAGLAWAVSDMAQLQLISIPTGESVVWAVLPFGSWALGTLRNGTLVMIDSSDPQTGLVYDPVTSTEVDWFQLELDSNTPISRAAVDPGGKLWLASAETNQLWRVGVETLEVQVQDVDTALTVDHGDHAFHPDNSLLVVGFSGAVSRMDAITLQQIEQSSGLGGKPPADLTGIVVDPVGGEAYVSSGDGTIWQLVYFAGNWELEMLFQAEGSIDDLAPVRAPLGACPGLLD
ncbi:MAG: hypothetical protein AAF721_40840, partial [Myxococcota bacterium]